MPSEPLERNTNAFFEDDFKMQFFRNISGLGTRFWCGLLVIVFGIAGRSQSGLPPHLVKFTPVLLPYDVGKSLPADCTLRLTIVYESGIVSSVKIIKSSGAHALDEAALISCGRWRFQPKTTHQADVSVCFKKYQILYENCSCDS